MERCWDPFYIRYRMQLTQFRGGLLSSATSEEDMYAGFAKLMRTCPRNDGGMEMMLKALEGLGDFVANPSLKATIVRDCAEAVAGVGDARQKLSQLDDYCQGLFRRHREAEIDAEVAENERIDREEHAKFLSYVDGMSPSTLVSSIRQIDGLWAAVCLLDAAEEGDTEAEEIKNEILSLARTLPNDRF
jgi:hypothetical protein